MATMSDMFPALTSATQLASLVERCRPGTSLSSATAQDQATADKMTTNALAAVAAYGRVENEGPGRHLVSAEAMPIAIDVCSTHTSAQVRAAAADAICSLLSNPTTSDSMKASAIQAEITRKIMGCITENYSRVGSADPRQQEDPTPVLLLLSIGMVLAQDSEGQKSIASSPVSVSWLLQHRRQQNDADIQALSSDILTFVSNNSDTKEAVAASMRSMVS